MPPPSPTSPRLLSPQDRLDTRALGHSTSRPGQTILVDARYIFIKKPRPATESVLIRVLYPSISFKETQRKKNKNQIRFDVDNDKTGGVVVVQRGQFLARYPPFSFHMLPDPHSSLRRYPNLFPFFVFVHFPFLGRDRNEALPDQRSRSRQDLTSSSPCTPLQNPFRGNQTNAHPSTQIPNPPTRHEKRPRR